MRFADINTDYWELRSGEASHTANPDTFSIPDLSQRQNLKVGQAAKLIFEMELLDENEEPVIVGERMWVIVSERVNNAYIGILDNAPASLEPGEDVYLCFGAEIPFRAEHVIAITQPPEEYVRWQLEQNPERVWPRT